MGVPNPLKNNAVIALVLSLPLLAGMTGCSFAPPVQTNRLIRHRAFIDFSGLKPLETLSSVKVTAAPPSGWDRLPARKSLLYTHEQWRSPSAQTGVGVAYVRLPLPLSAQAIAWFAKQEYGRKADDGKIISEWTDSMGRAWFEAENRKYHVRGYVATRGSEAWIVYSGYRLTSPPDPAEVSLAARSAETFVPGSATASDPSTSINLQKPNNIVETRAPIR
jgi:hypothetical protein